MNWTGYTHLSELESGDKKNKLVVVENPIRNKELKLRTDLMKGDFRLDIIDSVGKVVKQLFLKQTEEEILSIPES